MVIQEIIPCGINLKEHQRALLLWKRIKWNQNCTIDLLYQMEKFFFKSETPKRTPNIKLVYGIKILSTMDCLAQKYMNDNKCK